jgi:hypothetical protein
VDSKHLGSPSGHLSGEKKYQVHLEVKTNPGKKGEILRREGLYQNELRRYDDIV